MLPKQLKMKQKIGGSISMVLGTLGARLLGNLLTGKGVMKAGEHTISAQFLMPPHPLTNSEMQKYY